LTEASRRSERLAWLALAAWAVLIYATVPIVFVIQTWVKDHFGAAAFLHLTIAGFVVGALACAMVARRVARRLTTASTLWLLAVTAVGIGWAYHLRDNPVEAIHLLEYGCLGLLAANALRHRTGDTSLYLQATLVCALIGTFDEIIQWLTPDRYFDLRDIWLNTGASALAQIALWKRAPLPRSHSGNRGSCPRRLL
jgi:hypothetical protein